jgi:hypothetical protein
LPFAQALTIIFFPGRVLLRGTLHFIFALPRGILFSPGVVVTATIQPATHHPQITGAIVHRVAVLVVDVFAISLSDFARGHCFPSSRVSIRPLLFRFSRTVVPAVLCGVVSSQRHVLIVTGGEVCPDPAGKNKKNF